MKVNPAATGGVMLPYGDLTDMNVGRPGRSLIAIGGSAETEVGAGGTATIEFATDESGLAGRLIIGGASLDGITVTQIKHNNDDLLTGAAPASLFAADCVHNPAILRRVTTKDNFKITLANSTAAAVDLAAVLTAL